MNTRQRRFALCGGICGVVYFVNQLFPIPDFLRGFTLGLAIGFLLLALLPEALLEKLRKWKCGN